LTRQAYAPWVERVGREPLPMTADYEAAVRDHLIALAHCGDELCALVEMVVEPGCLLIENLAVSPDHQGNGLGTALLRHAEKQAENLGLSSVRLYTNRAFGSNVAFYERHGFTIESEEPFMGGWTVYMRKPLGK
jgi:ribosomal protein S18 acetylase RimI-like enzyme